MIFSVIQRRYFMFDGNYMLDVVLRTLGNKFTYVQQLKLLQNRGHSGKS